MAGYFSYMPMPAGHKDNTVLPVFIIISGITRITRITSKVIIPI